LGHPAPEESDVNLRPFKKSRYDPDGTAKYFIMDGKDSARPSPETPDNALRFQKCFSVLQRALEKWEEEHPSWKIEVLLWVLDRALISLRKYIEMEDEAEITWASPYVELHFPVDCIWDESSTAEQPAFHFNTGNLNATDIADDETAAAALSRLLVRHIEIIALQEWTNSSAFEKRGETLRPVGTAEDVERVKAIADPEERFRTGQALFRGISFGAGRIDYGDLEEGEEIGEEAAEQLAAIEEPLVFMPIELDGHRLRLITILEIKPPIADFDNKRAYFPILVGIAIQADEGEEITSDWIDKPWANFSTWAKEDREVIWEPLHKLIEMSLEALGPIPKPEMIEAVISVNAEIKVVVEKGDEAKIQRAMAQAMNQLQSTGEILKLDIKLHEEQLTPHVRTEYLRELLEDVERSEGTDARGRSLEKLAAALFSSIPDFSVSERISTETEEIDLWVINNSNDRPFSDEGDIILVECKNWTGKCGKNEFGALMMKMTNRVQRCTIGFLVSWNGFANTIDKEMLRASQGKALIVPLDGNDMRVAVTAGDFLGFLKDKRNQALMI
jgi:hypothetical protein